MGSQVQILSPRPQSYGAALEEPRFGDFSAGRKMDKTYTHKVQVYYEDTDHSGVVYHANYLKYFERAREHMLGVESLVSLYREQGIGFVVYQARLKYLKGAQFGDQLSIQSTVRKESGYRLAFMQDAYGPAGELLVKGEIELACVNSGQQLVPIPERVLLELQSRRGI